ncbi:MAG: cyclic nucleotide-binding domain-containing protein [Desulfobacterales bacterium]|jgi:CRP-like cAMP-binding protein
MTDNVTLAGNLSFLNLGELLQLLGTNASSGTLRITSKYASHAGLIYMEKGNPINATNGSKSGLEALFSLFGWKEGQFEFIQESISNEKVITKSRMEIILDGLRLLDEGHIQVLGPTSTSVGLSDVDVKSDSTPLIKGPLVDYSLVVDEEGFYDGDEIVQEGNHGNWIWVILEGVAEIIKKTDAEPLKILRIGDGAFLGSVASLLKGDNVRSATVTAAGNVQLGMLDAQLMRSELANLSLQFRDLVSCIDMRLKDVTNMATAIHCKDEKITQLVNGKKTLVKQGKNEERLFRIRSGEAIVARETNNAIVPLVHLKEGAYFGHMPFFDIGHEPYSASVFASSDLKISAVKPQELQKEYNELSSTLKNIFEHLATCISATTLIACDYFKKSFCNDAD